MLKHIVLWKLKEFAEGRNKLENAKLIKKGIEALKKDIKEIIKIEVGINVVESDTNYDASLYSEFKDEKSLNVYLAHPAHKKIAELISKLRDERVGVDYIV